MVLRENISQFIGLDLVNNLAKSNDSELNKGLRNNVT